MLTTVDLRDASGINGVEWDAVELASQFMENWCYEKPVLIGMTQHVETGEPLPDDLFDKLVEARSFMAGYGMMRQVTLGQTDLELYHRYVVGATDESTANDVEHRVATQCMPVAPVPEGRMLCAFGHIFAGGYSAGYYSYLWSEVLSADAFAAFEEAGLGDDAAVQKLGRTYAVDPPPR
jgi:oligopeptidase A